MKAGDDGADMERGVGSRDRSLPSGIGCGWPPNMDMEGVGGAGGRLRERFLLLRGRLLGDSGRVYPGPGLGGQMVKSRELLRLPRPVLKVDDNAIVGLGESGDESGVARSSLVVESTVETVVVGDELLDDEVEVDTLWSTAAAVRGRVGGIVGRGGGTIEKDGGGGGSPNVRVERGGLLGEHPDMSTSRSNNDASEGTAVASVVAGLERDLLKGYRRFSDRDMRSSGELADERGGDSGGPRAGTLKGLRPLLSDGDGGLDSATSV